jgi:hypothetical protein
MSGANAQSTGTALILAIAGAAGTQGVALTVTLSGLTLGSINAGGRFLLSTAQEAGTQEKPASAILPAPFFTGLFTSSNVAGSSVGVVLTFTPITEVPVSGSLNLVVPAGFLTVLRFSVVDHQVLLCSLGFLLLLKLIWLLLYSFSSQLAVLQPDLQR